MKKLVSIMALPLVLLVTGGQLANAASIDINLSGTVTASPCIVNNNESNLNINLGTDIQASSLAVAGSGSSLIPFTIALTSCPLGTNGVIATFSGTPDTEQPTMYANTGSAANVAVELSQQTTGTVLGNNSTLELPVEADKTVNYALNARAYSKGDVMPGNISSVVQVNFTYN